MRKWKLLNKIFLVFLVLTIFALIVINLPPNRTIFQNEITNQLFGTYDLKVSIPKTIWFGKNEKIFLDLKPVQSNGNLNSSLKTEFANVEIDFILTGGNLFPPGLHVTPLIPAQDINLDWRLTAENYDEIPGSVRVFINPTADLSSSNQARELIFSKDFSIKIYKILDVRILWFQIFLISQFVILSALLLYSNFKKKNHNEEKITIIINNNS